MKIYAFYINSQWAYVEKQEDIPDDALQSFEAIIDDLSADEEEYFSSDCLIYDGDTQTVSFDHARFDAEIRNKLFIDATTDEGRQINWLSRRIAAYPNIGDQLDMIYHDQLNGTNKWRDAITAAKLSTPKPL